MPYAESTSQLELELDQIKKWENDQRNLWFWEKIGRMPFQLLDRLTPKAIQRKLGSLLDELGSYVQTGGKYLVSEQHVMKKLQQNAIKHCGQALPAAAPDKGHADTNPTYPSIAFARQLPLAVRDRTAEQLREELKHVASLQGAATGIGGIITLSIDIPAMLGMSLKVIQETAFAYGFDPNQQHERAFVVKCLQFVSSDIVGKQAILKELSAYEDESRSSETLSEIQGWSETVIAFTHNIGWTKLFQIIPIAGIAIGSIMNRSHIHDVAETAQMMYKKRAIHSMLRERKRLEDAAAACD